MNITEIQALFPDECPQVAKSLTNDEIIVQYLESHDVFVKPVSSNIQPSALTQGAIVAMAGPIASGMNQGLTTQRNAAALQEWTSWKQWALDRHDFSEFKKHILNKLESDKIKQENWILENKQRIEDK